MAPRFAPAFHVDEKFRFQMGRKTVIDHKIINPSDVNVFYGDKRVTGVTEVMGTDAGIMFVRRIKDDEYPGPLPVGIFCFEEAIAPATIRVEARDSNGSLAGFWEYDPEWVIQRVATSEDRHKTLEILVNAKALPEVTVEEARAALESFQRIHDETAD